MNKICNLLMTEPIIQFDKDGNVTTRLEDICNNYPCLILNDRQLCDYEMIQNGGFHPLTGFMTQNEYTECVNNMKLPSGTIWPIPITLHVSEKWLYDNLLDKTNMERNNFSLEDVMKSNKFKRCLRSTYSILRTDTGIPLAIMKNESIYKHELFNEAEKVYDAVTEGNLDTNHPYVKILSDYHASGMSYCLGGKLILGRDVPRYDFKEFRMSPNQAKEKFIQMGWTSENREPCSRLSRSPEEVLEQNFSRTDCNIIGFQTRNPLHKSHFQLTKNALEEATKLNGKPSKLFLNPVVGITQLCDINYHTRVKCYKELIKKYAADEAILSLLPLSMRMSGPREAVWHAIIRKNYGVTHFVVGRDHAGPSYNRSNGKKFYEPYDAQNLLINNAEKIGIIPIVSKMIVFSIDKDKVYKIYSNKHNKKIEEITDEDIRQLNFMCELDETDGKFKSIEFIDSNKEIYYEISGTQQRKLLYDNKPIPNWFSYPEIISILRKEFRKFKGIVFYFIGLSGSGKSTLANNFISLLKEQTFKPITYLDGDIIRLNLSKGLGFSKEDRSANVRRIGYVASEIAKHGGICVVANIAPYEADRIYNREQIETNDGVYVEIYVNTSIDICSARDTKGLYKMAMENKIKLTGVNDPFEAPVNPNIYVNGAESLEISLDKIMKFINDSDIFFD